MSTLVSILVGTLVLVSGFLGFNYFNQEESTGALSILKPSQGGTGIGSVTAGEVGTCLKVLDEDPFTYELGVCGSGGGGGSFPFTATTNYGQQVYSTTTPTIWLRNGVFASSTSHFVNASSTQQTIFGNLYLPSFTAGQLLYGGGTGAISAVATGTLSASAPLSLTGTTAIVGTSRTLSLDTSGTWSGNAGTASALATNGSNCSAGSFPLGVDTAGAVESCTDAWTEAENTAAAYVNAAGTMTGTYDGNNFAGGAIGAGDLLYGASAGSITELAIGASSTALTTNGTVPAWQKLSINDLNSFGTTTLAGGISGTRADFTSTSTFDGIFVETGGIRNKMLPNCDTVDTNASGDFVCGSDASGGGGATFGKAWEVTTNYNANALAPTTTMAVWANSNLYASSSAIFHSTLTVGNNVSASYFTATSTSLASSLPLASTTRLSALTHLTVGGTATTTIVGDTGTSTFSSGITASRLDATASSTFDGIVVQTGGIRNQTLISCDSVDTNASGDLVCGTDATATGAANDFSFATNFNIINAATTSVLWGQSGINASSTSHFDNASTTLLTATTAWLTNLFIGVDTIAEYIADTAGAMFSGNTETDITITYDDADNTIDAVVDTLPNLTGTLDYDSGGTGTTTAPSGQLIYGGATAYQSVATSSASCTTGVSCSAFTVVGTVAPSITATLGTSVDLTSEVTGDLPFSNLAQVSANSVLGNPTNATADAQSVATSSLFAAGTPGNVLTFNGSAWVPMATATCQQITGSADLCDGSDASGGAGGASDFTWSTTYNTLSAATSSAVWLTSGSLFASSTAFFHSAITIGNNATASYFTATSTSLASSLPLASTTRLSALTHLTIGSTGTTTIVGDSSTSTFSGGISTNNIRTTLAPTFDPLTSAVILTNAAGQTAEYAGTSCTNQAITALSALAAATCNSITNAYFSDADWGDITIASNAASVEDDSHAHTGSTISGVDISADTNLTAGDALTLTDDDIDFDGGASPGGILGGTWSSPTLDAPWSATSFPANSILYSNASGVVAATGTTLYSGNFVGTTTATSTLVGGLDLTRLNTSGTSTFTGLRVGTQGLTVTTLASCDTIDTDASGNFKCGSDATASGAANPFTWSSTFNTLSAATSSSLWVQGSLFASSTSYFTGASTFVASPTFQAPLRAANGSASSPSYSFTNNTGSGLYTDGTDIFLDAADQIYSFSSGGLDMGGADLTSLATLTATGNIYTSAGKLSAASSSPWAQLSVHPNGITGPAFAIGSSTKTDFIVSNGGNVGVGTTSPGTLFGVQGALTVTTATSTILGNGLLSPRLNTTATSTLAGLVIGTQGLKISTMASCDTIDTDASGNFKCGTDNTTAGANPFTWASTFNTLSAATSSALWAQSAIYGSSTVAFGIAGRPTLFWDSAGKLGLGTTSPVFGSFTISGGTIFNDEYRAATSTSISLSFASSTQTLIRHGTGATTITIKDFYPGMVERIVVCNPNSAGGAITWATSPAGALLWNGGTTPTQTTTAKKCDLWTFTVTAGSSTPVIFGSQIANY